MVGVSLLWVGVQLLYHTSLRWEHSGILVNALDSQSIRSRVRSLLGAYILAQYVCLRVCHHGVTKASVTPWCHSTKVYYMGTWQCWGYSCNVLRHSSFNPDEDTPDHKTIFLRLCMRPI